LIFDNIVNDSSLRLYGSDVLHRIEKKSIRFGKSNGIGIFSSESECSSQNCRYRQRTHARLLTQLLQTAESILQLFQGDPANCLTCSSPAVQKDWAVVLCLAKQVSAARMADAISPRQSDQCPTGTRFRRQTNERTNRKTSSLRSSRFCDEGLINTTQLPGKA